MTAAKKRPMRPGWRPAGDDMSRRSMGTIAECSAYRAKRGWRWEVHVLNGRIGGTAPTEAAAQRMADAALLRAARRLAKAAGLEVRG